jgi:tetratricopeptide (TPR) repeat protein
VFQINLAYNLGQILQAEKRYQEALLYAKKAEEISIRGTEQFLLPEIEFEIAQILSKMGKSQESRTRIEALIPYMRLIGREQMADLAQEFLDENLTNDVN